tara:strand:- start:5733 stop:9662 length:3930 start_codon:yes stop_codon:yes gene_type:complete
MSSTTSTPSSLGIISKSDYPELDTDLNLNFDIETDLNHQNIKVEKYNDEITRFIFTFDENNNTKYSMYNFKLKKYNENEYHKCNILLVGGGGGGGYNIGGGGGGGRVVYLDNVLLKTDKSYKINVGSGGEGGNKDYYSGDTGYSSSIGNYIALGGGGGGSYTSSDLTNENLTIKDIKFANSNSNGLDGGSGGGNCFFSFEIETDIEYISGKNKDTDFNKYKKEENNGDFESYGNNGGYSKIKTKDISEDELILKTKKHKAAGGGGSLSEGNDVIFNDLNTNSGNSANSGNGGDGISIENISNKKYCFIKKPENNNINYCKNKELRNSELKYIQRNIDNLPDIEYLHWGAGGGGGSLNIYPGKGGKGGGGSGGYHELENEEINSDWKTEFETHHNNDKTNNCINLDVNNDDNFSYANFSTEQNNKNNKTLSKGGNGIKHTGSGGGGGGWNSNGGNGGSGIVIILVYNKDYEIKKNYQSIIETELKLLQLNNKFKKNKYILGTNLASLYHYYIKEHTYFLQYIEKIYENEILNKKDDLLHNYDLDTYNSKFNLYIKLIYDLKIEKDQFLFYTNGSEECNDNNELINQKSTLTIITNLIEDIMNYFSDKNNTLDQLQKYEKIKIEYNSDIENTKYEINDNNTIVFYISIDKNYIFELNDIKNIDENDNDENLDMRKIIQKYLKIILFVKKYNFDKNILALYIFFMNIELLQNLYNESEKLLKSKECIYNNELIVDNLDKLVDDYDNKIVKLKELYGYEYIDYYIDNVIFNNITLNNNNYPNVNFEIENKDNISIKKDDIINNFIVEIDNENLNNRYQIKNCEILDNNKIRITILVKDKIEYKFIDNNISKIYNIRLSHKDETFIKNNYNNDINKLKEYHEKIENIKINLQKISNNYNTYENNYNKILNKSYIYYTILTIASIFIIIIYLTNGTNSIKLSLLSIITIISIILVIYNNTTKIHLDIIDNFANFEKSYKILHEFIYNKTNLVNNKDSDGYIISIDYDNNNKLKKKLRIEITNSDDSNELDNLKNIFIKTHFIKIKKDDKYIEFEIENIKFLNGNCFDNYKFKNYKCIGEIVIKETEKLNNLLTDYTDDDIILQLIKYKNETSLEKLYDKNNYKIDKNIKDNFLIFLEENQQNNDDEETEKLVKLEKMKYITLIRDNVLSYINNKFIEINKIISNIELQKSNEIYNNVSKTLQKEKKTFNNYIKEYEYNKNINNNYNKIYKHKLISQISLNNFILNMYLILIIALLLYSLFPNYFNIIVVLLIFSITLNAIFYTIKQREYTRTDSYKKYWFKPVEKNNIIVNNNYI